MRAGTPARLRGGLALVLAAAALPASAAPPTGVIHEVRGETLGALEASSVALLLSGQSGGEIAGAALWTLEPTTVRGDHRRVIVLLDLDGSSLLEGDPGPDLAVVLLSYAVSERGEVAGRIGQGFRVPAGAPVEGVRARGLKLAAPITLSPGRWSLRVLARNPRTRRVLVARLVVDLPEDESAAPWLLPPLVAEPDDGWVLGLSSDLEQLPVVGREGRPATALPILTLGRPLELELTGTVNDGTVAARLVDSLGRAVDEPQVELEATGPRTATASLRSADLLPGHYGLVVTVEETAGSTSASQALPIAVITSAAPRASVSIDPEMAADASRAAELVLGALATLASGDETGAGRTIAALERACWQRGGVDSLRRLHAAELGLLRDLMRDHDDAGLPVAVLYRALAREYREPGEEPLALHAWSLAADLADHLAASPSVADGDQLAAAILVALARDHVLAGTEAFAVDLMRRALGHLPHSAEILLGLAALEERRGHREEATDLLQRCLRVAPDRWEARLRLGVNLARTRSSRRAVEALEAVVEGDAPAWASAVAYHEMVRALADSGRRTRALEVVRDARRRLPEDQQLAVLESDVLGRLGQVRLAGQVALGVVPATDPVAPSPRMRYMSAPTVGLELWAIARARTTDALPALQDAILSRARVGANQPSQPG